MVSLHSIFKDIAALIGDNADKDLLISKIKNNQFDWEKIVQVASRHLVIPLIYYKLKSRELLHLLDDELHFYLEEIANQNYNRNLQLLKEVNEISSLLNKHKIDHVFLKGVAHLVGGLYENIGERMIGDIDILVNEKQLSIAQNLLLNNGYEAIETTFGQDFNQHKHLARLIPKQRLAAVEVHRKLLHKQVNNQLLPINILKNKRIIGNCAIPDYTDLLNHTILNFEINDYGYYYNYLGVRNAYDALRLISILSIDKFNNIIQDKYFSSFFNKFLVYFDVASFNGEEYFKKKSPQFFVLKQKNNSLRKIIYKILTLWQFFTLLVNRFSLFVMSSKYRKQVLNDRKRIQDLILTKIKYI